MSGAPALFLIFCAGGGLALLVHMSRQLDKAVELLRALAGKHQNLDV